LRTKGKSATRGCAEHTGKDRELKKISESLRSRKGVLGTMDAGWEKGGYTKQLLGAEAGEVGDYEITDRKDLVNGREY
jgi:hypothetical protein